ncbi:MAG: SusC/RagA family TonB-linked outer membrane protein [Sphingobacteriales bacterium]|nr:SusC/RagA family TonB-linked outer membrane protein [Sphingobacteriales bacterium]
MKLIAFCLLAFCLHVSARGFSQKVTLSVRNVPIQQVFREITRQTGVSFVYKETLLEGAGPVSIHIKDATIEEVLDLCLQSRQIGYKLVGKSIVIRKEALPPITAQQLPDTTQFAEPPPREIRGVVRNVNNAGLEGITITEKGTTNATTTRVDGSFHLKVADPNAVLVFSSIGFKTVDVALNGRTQLEVILETASQELSGVVVTALGITRAKKSLGYSVEEVGGEEFTRVSQENILNGMSGKIPGVTINSTGGTGSSVSMIIRGATSLSSDNQPLFVVDGVPIANTLNNIGQVGVDNRVDYGNALSSINPEDIESVTVLKGPSAAALYGSRAGNGVVLITTKSGRGARKLTVTATTNTVFDVPYKYLKFQHKYGSGQFSAIPVSASGNLLSNPFGSLIQENILGTYGAELDRGYKEVQWNSPLDSSGSAIAEPLVSHPNNVKNFVQTGITTTNGVSVANNNEQVSYRLSYSNMSNRGIIPHSDLYRNSLSLNTGLRINKSLRLSTNIDLSRNNSNNRPAGERGTNPLQWAYNVSPHTDIRDLKEYWLPGQEGIQQRTQYKGVFNNPYFLANEVKNSFVRDRLFGNVRLDWQLSHAFSFMARYALDTYDEKRETKISESYINDPGGSYGIVDLKTFESNADMLLTYKTEWKDFSLAASAGGNIRYQKGSSVTTATKDGTGLIVPGVFTIQNILPDNLNFFSNTYQKGVNSVYGLLNLGYKEMVFLDVTARNDWSSTLPHAQPYFYPSASLSLLVSDIAGIKSPTISLIKLRGGVAQVGNDANPYSYQSVLTNAGAWGSIPRLTTSSTLLNPDLKPEIATSYEGGIDINLFRNRLRFAATYYMVENKNQIFSTKTPPSSGYSSKNINAGLLRSKGIELSLGGTPVQSRNWKVDVNANLTRSRTRIIQLSDDLPYFTLWEDAKGGAWTYVGDQIGDIYDAKLVTVTDKASPYYGYPLLDNTGKWQSIDAINTRNKIGNFNPDFILGFQSSISYKHFTLSFTLDWRSGGDFVSQTYRYGEEYGQSSLFYDHLIDPGVRTGQQLHDYLVANQDKMIRSTGNNFPLVGGPTPQYNGFPFTYGPYTLPYGGVFVPGVRASGFDANGNPTGYYENLGQNINSANGTAVLPFAGATAWSFTRAFTFPASYLKLREISFAYDLPSRWVRGAKAQGASISVYSRNIILWTAAKINIDPENAFQPSTSVQGSGTQFKQGIERYNVNPWVIPVGVKLNVVF